MVFYIDPGTGSMLFAIIVGLLSACVYALRGLLVKLRFLFSGGKKVSSSDDALPFVIFTDDKRYWNIFCPICEEFERRKQKIVYMTASPDDPALSRKFQYVECQFIGEGNRAFAKLNFVKADVLLSSTPGLDVYQWKRSKDVKYYVHILHAVSDASMYHMFGLDYYDAVLLSGKYQADQIRELEQKRNLPAKELVIVGQPYMDELHNKIQAAPELAPHPVTVLLAPSWGKSGILSRYGSRIIDALLATGYHIIVRPHPQSFISEAEMMDSLMKKYPGSDQLEWNRESDNFDVLRRSDILISDFSGIVFDYTLVFDKPLIYAETDYDNSPNDSCWLDEPEWTFETLPKIGHCLTEDTLDDLKAVIDESLDGGRYKDARDRAREESWAHLGESAGLTVDYLMETRQRILDRPEKDASPDSKKSD